MESFTAFIPINRCPLTCPWTPPIPSSLSCRSKYASFCFSFVLLYVLFYATLNINGDGSITSRFLLARTLWGLRITISQYPMYAVDFIKNKKVNYFSMAFISNICILMKEKCKNYNRRMHSKYKKNIFDWWILLFKCYEDLYFSIIKIV